MLKFVAGLVVGGFIGAGYMFNKQCEIFADQMDILEKQMADALRDIQDAGDRYANLCEELGKLDDGHEDFADLVDEARAARRKCLVSDCAAASKYLESRVDLRNELVRTHSELAAKSKFTYFTIKL